MLIFKIKKKIVFTMNDLYYYICIHLWNRDWVKPNVSAAILHLKIIIFIYTCLK